MPPPTVKRKQGPSADDNRWRNVCIVGYLIPPLLRAGFSATRNEATEPNQHVRSSRGRCKKSEFNWEKGESKKSGVSLQCIAITAEFHVPDNSGFVPYDKRVRGRLELLGDSKRHRSSVHMSITSTGLSDYELGTSTSIARYEPGAALESSTSVAKRLDRSRRTIERYVKLEILPEP